LDGLYRVEDEPDTVGNVQLIAIVKEESAAVAHQDTSSL
jgi:hypothetical protein